MNDSDISDGFDYDSDKDEEYRPQQETSKKEVRIKIRGRYYSVPLSRRSSSESNDYNSCTLETDPLSNKSSCSMMNKHNLVTKTANTSVPKINSKVLTTGPKSFLITNDSKTDLDSNIYDSTMAQVLKAPIEKNNCQGLYQDEEEHCPQNIEKDQIMDISENLPDYPGNTSQASDIFQNTEKKLTRKRRKITSEWACNIRKARFDQGLDYISSRKKAVPAKKIKNKKDCIQKCVLQCSRKISHEQRKEIFKNYYSLSAAAKKNYILNTTEIDVPFRRRKGKNENNSRKKKTYRYYFLLNGHKIQVCKDFYTGTLCISQKPMYTVHQNKTPTNTLRESKQGKHQKRVTSGEDTALVKEHINMFPRVKSHYCRKTSNKEYLESGMSIKKLYEMYLEYASEKEKSAVSFCVYRKIFCNSFNIAFHKPRKDRCDTCEEMKVKRDENKVDEETERAYMNHLKEKEHMRQEKQNDKESGKPILCFDLENVLTCPKADIKNFFYKSKLNVYNMTGHLSVGKKVYCAIWTEALHGRTGNDIASAVYKILNKVMEDHPEFTEIILWSDSCVPQNRNSLMSYALTHLIQTQNNLQNITMKFSVPGHSCIQEVDAVHSAIERTLSKVEYYSPISLLRFLLKVNRQNPYKIIQMKKKDFIDFQFYSNQLNYNIVPFSKVVSLQFSKCLFELRYKDSFKPTENVITINLHHRKLRRGQTVSETEPTIPVELKKSDNCIALPQTKVDAIKSMYKWIPEMDRQYYEAIFKRQNKT